MPFRALAIMGPHKFLSSFVALSDVFFLLSTLHIDPTSIYTNLLDSDRRRSKKTTGTSREGSYRKREESTINYKIVWKKIQKLKYLETVLTTVI